MWFQLHSFDKVVMTKMLIILPLKQKQKQKHCHDMSGPNVYLYLTQLNHVLTKLLFSCPAPWTAKNFTREEFSFNLLFKQDIQRGLTPTDNSPNWRFFAWTMPWPHQITVKSCFPEYVYDLTHWFSQDGV